MVSAYYNEHDPYAAQWLRNLIAAGHIAQGDVDERSIEDVSADDLAGYRQCHFFAGIGVWSHALRRAGWDDSRPVWTGSCPCQPFSAAGKGEGIADERHLWPAWHHLIEQCRPPVVFGEQVEAAIKHGWLDLVQSDMEGIGYAFAAAGIPAAGVGAPHIRQRLWFVADTPNERQHGRGASQESNGRNTPRQQPERFCNAYRLADAVGNEKHEEQQRPAEAKRGGCSDEPGGRGMDDTSIDSGPTNGFWRNADWLLCRDGKWRPVEPGYEQMADGAARSLGRVRASDAKKIEEEINEWSKRHKTDAGEALRGVWDGFSAQALSEREAGRFSGVQSPAVLLAFLRQLTAQGWGFTDAMACSRTEASEIVLRVLRFDAEAARTPLRRELEEQIPGEPSDALRELSSLLAHHAAACWGKACGEKTGAASFPLVTGAAARVGRLRAYGNAIVAQVAEEMITAYMECRP